MTTALTDLLAKVEELDKKATKGPWRAANGMGAAAVKAPDCAIYINVRKLGETDECVARWQRDAELVATYRNVLPAMAKALKVAHAALMQHDDDRCNAAALTEIESLLSEALK